jgi:hypothetical protein
VREPVRKPDELPAVGSPVERPVRPLAEPSMRRVIRAVRLCAELGHASDTLAALEELKVLRAAADAVLKEAQFYGSCYGTTKHGKEAMERLASILRPNV